MRAAQNVTTQYVIWEAGVRTVEVLQVPRKNEGRKPKAHVTTWKKNIL